MNRQPCESSQIKSAGHSSDDPDWDGEPDTLEVEFVSAGRPVWQYHPVSLRRFNAMMEAESIGKAFNRIKQDADVKAKKVSK
jgi:hypothetical protein